MRESRLAHEMALSDLRSIKWSWLHSIICFTHLRNRELVSSAHLVPVFFLWKHGAFPWRLPKLYVLSDTDPARQDLVKRIKDFPTLHHVVAVETSYFYHFFQRLLSYGPTLLRLFNPFKVPFHILARRKNIDEFWIICLTNFENKLLKSRAYLVPRREFPTLQSIHDAFETKDDLTAKRAINRIRRYRIVAGIYGMEVAYYSWDRATQTEIEQAAQRLGAIERKLDHDKAVDQRPEGTGQAADATQAATAEPAATEPRPKAPPPTRDDNSHERAARITHCRVQREPCARVPPPVAPRRQRPSCARAAVRRVGVSLEPFPRAPDTTR